MPDEEGRGGCLERVAPLLRLARLRVSGEEEACELAGYIRGMEEMARGLLETAERYGVGEPLYYVWEEGAGGVPGEPIVHERVSLERVAPGRLDGEGRLVLPWRGRR